MKQHNIIYRGHLGIYKIAKDNGEYIVLDGSYKEIERCAGFDEAYSMLKKYISSHEVSV